MNNLTTRKIVLGMVMVLVLAFSVQGIADAQLTLGKTGGDLQLERYDQLGQSRSNFSPLVFSINGLNTTVEAIETEVDVSDATIFYHFPARKNLYVSGTNLVDDDNKMAYVRNDNGSLVFETTGDNPATILTVSSDSATNSAIAAVTAPNINPFRISVSDGKLYHLNTLIVAKKTKAVEVDLQDHLTITYGGTGAGITQITGVSGVSSTSAITFTSSGGTVSLYEVSDLDDGDKSGTRAYETLTHNSISMSISFTAAGEHTVEVSHALAQRGLVKGSAGDGDNGLPENTVLTENPPRIADPITFRVYATKQTAEYDSFTFEDQNAYDITYGSELKAVTLTLAQSSGTWVPVVFEVVDGRGMLYEVEHEVDTTPGKDT